MSFIVAHFVRFASYAGLSSGIVVPETAGESCRSDRISKSAMGKLYPIAGTITEPAVPALQAGIRLVWPV
jgi:hypothetical protein